MTKSSTKELITPFENPKSVFRSKRRLFETLVLVESSSSELDLFSDIEEHSEKETTEIMTAISKELRENTFSGSEHEDANEHIEKSLRSLTYFIFPRNEPSCSITNRETLKIKFLNNYCPHARTTEKIEEINNFQQEPDESLFRAWERFKELLMKCPQHYLTYMQEVILFYNALDVPTRQILDFKGAILTKTTADAKITTLRRRDTLEEAYYIQFGAPYQPAGQYRAAGPGFYQRNNRNSSCPDQRQTLEESLTKFMAESAKRHRESSNIIKEIRASTDAAIRNQRASIKTSEIQIGQMRKVLQERGIGTLVDLGASMSVIPFSTYTNLGLGILPRTRLTIELAGRTIKQPRGIAENVLVRIGKFIFPVDFIILDIPEDDDVP
ncbi:hypothetical protein Tco_0226354 [Tanacetum coccineum]